MAKLPSVYKRAGSPLYWGSLMINGTRKQYALCENKAAAQRMLAEIKAAQKARSKYGATSWVAFKERFNAWNTANTSPKTTYHDSHAIAYFERFKHPNDLSDITLSVLEDFQTWLKNTATELAHTYKKQKGIKRPEGMMGNDAINRVVRSMKKIFRKAEEWELLPPQKWTRIKKFKTAKGRVAFFSLGELRLLVDAGTREAETHNGYSPNKTATLLGALAGLRRGEMTHLSWDDVNLETSKISIQPKQDWHPKDYECRDVDIPEALHAYLMRLPHSKKCNNVLYDYYGDPYDMDCLTTRYRKFVKSAGLTGSLHKLRHTFASQLVQNGVDLYTVSKLLGHSSIQTTEIYAHLSPLTFAAAVQKFPKF